MQNPANFLIQNPANFALLMATLGQLLLVISLLLIRVRREPAYLPLIVFFIASTASCALPTLGEFWPVLSVYGLAIVLPAFLIQPVALWFYVQALTSPSRWYPGWGDLRVLWPFAAGLVGSVWLMAIPRSSLEGIFLEHQEPDSTLATAAIIYAVLLMLLWILLSGIYLYRIFRQLHRYRRQLKQVFASHEQRELLWLSWLLAIVVSTWLLSMFQLLPGFANRSGILGIEWVAGFYFVLVWSLSVWGLRQKPGFAGHYLEGASLDILVLDDVAKTKYRKSALDEAQIQRITQKLETAMERDQVFLDASLSLQSLASHLQVPVNYLSQTLNQALDETFFDYINRWRIEYAMPAVRQGRESILDIAMRSGFNARSSFYKAFKRVAGKTPTEYRDEYSAGV